MNNKRAFRSMPAMVCLRSECLCLSSTPRSLVVFCEHCKRWCKCPVSRQAPPLLLFSWILISCIGGTPSRRGRCPGACTAEGRFKFVACWLQFGEPCGLVSFAADVPSRGCGPPMLPGLRLSLMPQPLHPPHVIVISWPTLPFQRESKAPFASATRSLPPVGRSVGSRWGST